MVRECGELRGGLRGDQRHVQRARERGVGGVGERGEKSVRAGAAGDGVEDVREVGGFEHGCVERVVHGGGGEERGDERGGGRGGGRGDEGGGWGGAG